VGTGSLNFFFNNLLAEIATKVADKGLKQSLSGKIEAARASFSRGLDQNAILQLTAFEQQVSAQSGKNLSSSEATKLLQLAKSIIGQL